MKKIEKALIEHLKKRAPNYSWYGHAHRRGASSFKLRLKPEEACYRINLKTVINGKALIMIRLTLVYIASYDDQWEEFDQNKHCYWFELELTDILAFSGRKTICSFKIEPVKDESVGIGNGSIKIKDIQELYDKVKEMARFEAFSSKEIAVTKNNAIETVLQMI